jgi:hypothetical protein
LIGSLFLFSIFVDDPNAIETVNVKPVVKVENKTIVEEPAEGMETEDVPVAFKCNNGIIVVIHTNDAKVFNDMEDKEPLTMNTTDFNKYSISYGEGTMEFNIKESKFYLYENDKMYQLDC